MLDKPAGTYQEERLWLIAEIEGLRKDLNVAHDRIRKVMAEDEKRGREILSLKIRTVQIGAACGTLVALLVELGKHLFFK